VLTREAYTRVSNGVNAHSVNLLLSDHYHCPLLELAGRRIEVDKINRTITRLKLNELRRQGQVEEIKVRPTRSK